MAVSKTAVRNEYYDTIRFPVITEKTTAASDQDKIVFVVDKRANKKQIKAAVEGVFDVEVVSVNTLNRKGKTKRVRGRPGRRADVKRAYVTLREGQSIDVATGF